MGGRFDQRIAFNPFANFLERDFGGRVDALLFLTAFQALREKGFTRAEISWILEDNWVVLRMSERLGGTLYKRYRIYELPL